MSKAGTSVTNEELIRNISARQPGTVAHLGVVRDARHFSLPVKLGERPPRDDGDTQEPDGGDAGSRSQPRVPEVPLGLAVRDLDRGVAGRLAIPDTVQGVIVARVDPTGTAFPSSIRRGFVIMEINRKPIRSVADYQRIAGVFACRGRARPLLLRPRERSARDRDRHVRVKRGTARPVNRTGPGASCARRPSSRNDPNR